MFVTGTDIEGGPTSQPTRVSVVCPSLVALFVWSKPAAPRPSLLTERCWHRSHLSAHRALDLYSDRSGIAAGEDSTSRQVPRAEEGETRMLRAFAQSKYSLRSVAPFFPLTNVLRAITGPSGARIVKKRPTRQRLPRPTLPKPVSGSRRVRTHCPAHGASSPSLQRRSGSSRP